jgi:hypothetical protein
MNVKLFGATLTMYATIMGAVGHADPVVLITSEEAARPVQQNAALSRRGVTRAPQIELLSPAPGASAQSPLHLQIKFETHGGAKIDLATVKVTYLKNPAVDLSDRVKSFTQASGIDVDAVQIPPGSHPFRIDVKDTDGRPATALFNLTIGP